MCIQYKGQQRTRGVRKELQPLSYSAMLGAQNRPLLGTVGPATGSWNPITPQVLSQNRQRTLSCSPTLKQASVTRTVEPPRLAKKSPFVKAAQQKKLTNCTQEKWNQQSELH